MKKFRVFTFVLGALVLASMVSCSKKEGVYNPKKKIQRVYYSSTYTDKYLDEAWDWNGKKLEAINHYTSSGNLSWTENFSYDGSRLIRVDDYLGSEYTTYEYDGNKLKTVNYYYRNGLETTATYTYDGSKLSKMTITNYDSKSVRNGHLESAYMPFSTEVAEVLDKCIAKAGLHNQDREIEVMTYQFTWNGNNISKIVVSQDANMATAILQYDDKNNPMQGYLNLYSETGESMVPILTRSTNNITQIVASDSDGDSEVVNFTYQYDNDKYPTMLIQQYGSGNSQIITYYEYDK